MTSTDRNKTKPDKNSGCVEAGEKLAERNRRAREQKKKKRGLRKSEDTKDSEQNQNSNSFSSKCRTLTIWTVA